MIPLPYYNLSEHHPSNRAICIHFLQRQQMLRASHFVLANYFGELWDYLRSPERLIRMHGLPVWWTPHVHDLALVFACAKHGFLDIASMREDYDLPYSKSCIERHMRFLTQYGSLSVVPVALGAVVKDSADLESWIQQAIHEFPDVLLLEARLEKMLEDLTKDLISSHPCRVTTVLCKQPRYGYLPTGERIGVTTLEEDVNNYLRPQNNIAEDEDAMEDDMISAAVSTSELTSEKNMFASIISRSRSDSNTIPAYIHQATASKTPLKDLVAQSIRYRRIHVSEFVPARPTSFEICEYSENFSNIEGGERDGSDEEGQRVASSPPLKAAKVPGYTNFKKGV